MGDPPLIGKTISKHVRLFFICVILKKKKINTVFFSLKIQSERKIALLKPLKDFL